MIAKSKTAILVSRIVICLIMLAGAIISLGAIEPAPTWYVYYTNLSNYFCLIVVLTETVFTAINFKRGQDKKQLKVAPEIKFAALIAILVTFLITNILLTNIFSSTYWSSAENVLMHFVNPILFWADWILFAEHKNTKWYFPLYELIFPLTYVVYILIRGAIIADTAAPWQKVYPYFFLNVTELGYTGVFLWVLGLVAIFLIFGYLIYLFDNFAEVKTKLKQKFQNKN